MRRWSHPHLAAGLHERQVAVVLGLGRPHALIEVRGIASRVLADLRRVDRARRRIPLRRVVATRFPRMHGDHYALAERIAHLREPAMPRKQLREQLLESRPESPAAFGTLPQRAHDAGSDRRLGNARGQGGCPGAPDRRSRKVTGIVLPEHDVRHEAVGPLRLEQRLDFPPGTVLIERRKAERDERGVPVPLERIHAPVGHRVAAAIVGAQDIPRALVQLHRHRLRQKSTVKRSV
jgi:hypothetical protein